MSQWRVPLAQIHRKMTNRKVNIYFIGWLVVFVIFWIAMLSCKTNNCPTAGVDTRDSIVYKDSIIPVFVPPFFFPGDKVTIHDTIPCPGLKWNASATSESGRTTVNASINNGKINIDCKTDSMIKVIDSLKAVVRLKEQYQAKTIRILVPVPDPYTPKWVWYLVSANALYLIAKVLIWKYNIPFKI